jgi:hypothetical protein
MQKLVLRGERSLENLSAEVEGPRTAAQRLRLPWGARTSERTRRGFVGQEP